MYTKKADPQLNAIGRLRNTLVFLKKGFDNSK